MDNERDKIGAEGYLCIGTSKAYGEEKLQVPSSRHICDTCTEREELIAEVVKELKDLKEYVDHGNIDRWDGWDKWEVAEGIVIDLLKIIEGEAS